ncbi:DUF4374 domain-containing protein [Halosquirtibacter laminarini]|uniref:DUF4374 domain-containing protein n=1 Tax=Halosquirtibacter laminarini TaxID=3374600 RepID=A0AC61NGD7_9BACT|nr:DUF4374 domain-containing protein [Prolixibacteraceae bacterium]
MKNNKFAFMFWSIFFLGLIVSCSKDEVKTEQNNKTKTPYVVALRTKATGGSTADYLLSVGDLMRGEITGVGHGVEQIGWRYFDSTPGRYLSIGYGDNNVLGYTVNTESGVLTNYGKMVFERLDMSAPVDDQTMLGIGAPWGGGTDICTMMIIDTKGLKVTKSKKVKLSNMTLEPSQYLWPTSARIVNGKLFLSFYLVEGKSFNTPVTDKAWVSVFDYPSLDYVKTIEDTRTGPLGQYGNSRMMVKTESGDIYCFSSCSKEAGFDTETKPSGAVRIKSGQTDFDSGYFFNIQDASGEGYEVVYTQYLGGGKVFARVVTSSGGDVKWAATSDKVAPCRYVILDIFQKSVTEIANLPKCSGGYGAYYLYDNGKVYVPIHDANQETYVYQVDPVNATAVKGAKVNGIDLPGIFKAEKAL